MRRASSGDARARGKARTAGGRGRARSARTSTTALALLLLPLVASADATIGAPDAGAAAYRSAAAPSSVALSLVVQSSVAQSSGTYRVRPGDTLYAVARRAGVAWPTLAALNGIRAPYVIRVGQTLRLRPAPRPAGRPTPRPAPAPGPTPTGQPSWAASLPATTTQVVRSVPSTRWCARVYCTLTQAWQKSGGRWRPVPGAVFRSQSGPRGFAPPGARRQGDGRTPTGVYPVAVTFSTTATSPGSMPWRRRYPTSTVSNRAPYYNTWIEEPGRTDGTRPSMRYGLWIGYNNPRLVPGRGPAAVPGLGSGIFMHTSRPGREWVPTEGCIQVGDPARMKWILQWLDPRADPRIVLNR